MDIVWALILSLIYNNFILQRFTKCVNNSSFPYSEHIFIGCRYNQITYARLLIYMAIIQNKETGKAFTQVKTD